MAGRVMFVRYGTITDQLLGYSSGAKYSSYSGVLRNSMQSFAALADQAALSKQPVHLQLVRLPRAMAIEEFYRQYPSAVRLELIAAINGVNAGETLAAGTMGKRVQ